MTGRVCILHNAIEDGASLDARDVLVQVEEVSAALTTLGYEALPLAVGLDLEHTRAALRDLHPVGAFNLIEDVGGHAELISAVPMLLDGIGVPYTGASATGMFLTSNKVLTKVWLERHALPTPPWFEIEPSRCRRLQDAGSRSPCGEDASGRIDRRIGRRECREGARRLSHVRADGGTWFAESYIVVARSASRCSRTAPEWKCCRSRRSASSTTPRRQAAHRRLQGEWNEDSFEYRHTLRDFAIAKAEQALHTRLAALARTCWQLFDMRGYARVDLRVDPQGEPWVLGSTPIRASPPMPVCRGPGRDRHSSSARSRASSRQRRASHARLCAACEPRRPPVVERAGARDRGQAHGRRHRVSLDAQARRPGAHPSASSRDRLLLARGAADRHRGWPKSASPRASQAATNSSPRSRMRASSAMPATVPSRARSRATTCTGSPCIRSCRAAGSDICSWRSPRPRS